MRMASLMARFYPTGRNDGIGGEPHTVGIVRRRGAARVVLAALACTLAVIASALPVRAEPIFEPIKVELASPAPGIYDLNDPPLLSAPDPALLTLEVPTSHPWMLFDTSELPALRQRILGAPADSVVGQAWQALLDDVNDPEFTDRGGFLEGLLSIGDRDWGREDLVSVAFVWHITQDDRYLAIARQLLQYALGASPDYGAPLEPGVDEFYIQRAHRLHGFALAYDLLHPGLTPIERTQLRLIVETLGAQHFVHADTAWWGLVSAGSNIGANNAAALGTAGLALWHDNPLVRTWVLRGEQIVRGYFFEGFDPEGAGIEGVLYGNYGMRIPTFLGHALERAGVDGFFEQGGVDHQQEWFAHEVLPGGGAVNPLNDARYFEINPVFTTWSMSHGDTPALSRWLFEHMIRRVPGGGRNLGELVPTLLWYQPPVDGFDPSQQTRLAEDFASRGLVHVRSGWADDALLATFEARQSDWGEEVHRNQDVGQFTLYSDGAKLIVDSRYGNWLSKLTGLDTGALATSESAGHNLVVADGRSQDFFGKGDLVGFASTARQDAPGSVDLAHGDARLAWMVGQPRVADRFFLHVRADGGAPDYVVVADRFVQDGGPHRYTSYLHTDWRNEMTIDADDPGRVRIDSGEVSGVGLDVDVNVGGPFTSAIGSFTPDDAQDWDRIGEPGRKTHDRLEVRTSGVAHEAIQVLAPTGAGESSPPVRRVGADGGIASVVDVAPGVRDVHLLATGAGPVAAEGVVTDARFATVRLGPEGVEHVAFAAGTFVDVDGVRVIETDGGVGTVAADDAVVDGVAGPVTPAQSSATPAAPGAAAAAPSSSGTPSLPATGGGVPPAGSVLGVALLALVLRRTVRGGASPARRSSPGSPASPGGWSPR